MATNGLLSGGGPLFGGTASDIGILGYTPVSTPGPTQHVSKYGSNRPIELAMFEGSNPYENYVRAWPDLLQHYLHNIPEDERSMADWGKAHWQQIGQYENDPSLSGWRASGMPGDLPIARKEIGPSMFPASRFLPGMAEEYDPRAGITETTYSAGLPQPEVEGYKYEYPVYSWGGTEDPSYSYVGHTTADIDEYPYYPYEPTGAPLRSKNDRVLIGQRLVLK